LRILVTGSEGLVGKRLVPALVKRGFEVESFDVRRNVKVGLEDVSDREAMASALAEADGVIHLAAISRVAWGEEHPDLCEKVNVEGTSVLLETAAKSARRPWVVFASSREVYGDPPVLPVSEDAPVQPINVYGRSKAAGEVLVGRARAENGLRAAVVRLSSVYGTVDDHHDRAIPALLWRALQGEKLSITGANNRFDFVHVDDSVDGLLRAAAMLIEGASQVSTVHLATGVGTSLSQLAHLAVATAQSGSKIDVLPPRPFDVGGFVGDPARAMEVLGWTAKIGLADGMKQLAAAMTGRGRPLDTAQIPDPQTIASGR
jgi:nucleoside-diphosphate-sugar epimerase